MEFLPSTVSPELFEKRAAQKSHFFSAFPIPLTSSGKTGQVSLWPILIGEDFERQPIFGARRCSGALEMGLREVGLVGLGVKVAGWLVG